MSVKLPTEHHLEFQSLKGGCTGSSGSTLDKMPHCWKSCVYTHIYIPAQSLIYKPALSLSYQSNTTGQSLYNAVFGVHRNKPCYK